MYSVSNSVKNFWFATDKTSFLTADLKVTPVAITELAERGISSRPAVVVGNPLSVNIDTSFDVNELSNQFSVTVNDVTDIPYTGGVIQSERLYIHTRASY